tara:strand:- start:438 stop:656 length:219 start_codon:yes stop_codon:yes gene_type:complete
MEQTLTLKLNDEQLENFENLVMEAIRNLPDDFEELLEADPDSPAGTYRDIIKAMSQQTNRGSAIDHYMNCEV